MIPVENNTRIYTPNGSPKIQWSEPLDDIPPPFPSWAALGDAEIIVEGEFDCILAIQEGLRAISGTTGAGAFNEAWADALRGPVVILYDNDSAGEKGATNTARVLAGRGVSARIVRWPDNHKKGFDLTDFFLDGGTASELRAYIEGHSRLYEKPEPESGLRPLGTLVAELDLGTSVVPTGFKNIDDIIFGLRRGELLVLAARPKVGKSTLAQNMATNLARGGLNVAVFSLEMSDSQILERLISAESGVPKTHLERGLSDDDIGALFNHLPRIWSLPILMDTEARITPKELAKRAKSAGKLDAIIVDYVQLLDMHEKSETRARQVMGAVEELKVLAKELNCAMIVLSQVNREGARGIDEGKNQPREEEPQLHQLYESGGIEAHADTVIILWRKRKDEKAAIEAGLPVPTHFRVAKNRNGPEGYGMLTLHGPVYTFREV